MNIYSEETPAQKKKPAALLQPAREMPVHIVFTLSIIIIHHHFDMHEQDLLLLHKEYR